MLFILFVLGSCALLTSGWVAVTLWILFYGSLAFITASLILHLVLHLRSLPPRPIGSGLFGPNAPYWNARDLVLPNQAPLFTEDCHA